MSVEDQYIHRAIICGYESVDNARLLNIALSFTHGRQVMQRPPLNAIRAFEASARHLNFTLAGVELNMTPGGVSRHVRLLEDDLGVRLFVRGSRGVTLTGVGIELARHITHGLGQIADAVDAARQKGRETTIAVSSAPSFAVRWLMPRLDRFLTANPSTQVRLDATANIVDLACDDIDLAIRHRREGPETKGAHLLAREDVFPVCSPHTLAGRLPLHEPVDLLRHRLLHADWWATREGLWPDWSRWLSAAGVTAKITGPSGPTFALAGLAMQQAAQGRGIALGSDVLAADDLASGALVAPFGSAYRMESRCGYYLVGRGGSDSRARASDAFRDWLVAELQVALHASLAARNP